MGQGVIASSWFRLRGNPEFLTLSKSLFSICQRFKREIATSLGRISPAELGLVFSISFAFILRRRMSRSSRWQNGGRHKLSFAV